MNIWQKLWLAFPVVGLLGSFANVAEAQGIVPDASLGAEGSVVTPEQMVRGALADRIDGGAIRGANLFHSFEDFNVQTNGRVYFSSPSGIANILSRVTGQNLSNIDGTLGVDGLANLFFINPNGIVFGQNARLDVTGSFVAATADRFEFSDGQVFSARSPGAAPLVEVNIPIGVQFGDQGPAALRNSAVLTAGKDLRLSAGTVESEGALEAPAGEVRVEGVAGDVAVRAVKAESAVLAAAEDLVLEESDLRTQGDLSLLAEGTVRVRDSEETAFLAAAGGDLLVQGNEQVDILALDHLEVTPFQSGGDLTLASGGNVSADAHFSSFGNFSIETLEGDPGDFFSLYDPIISSNSNVTFGNYTGAALKVESRDSISAGKIRITGRDTTFSASVPSGFDPDTAPIGPENDLNRLGSSQALILRAGLANLENPPLFPNTISCLGPDCTSAQSQSSIGSQGSTFSIDNTSSGGDISVSSIDTQISGVDAVHVDEDFDASTPSNNDDKDPSTEDTLFASRGPVILYSRTGNIEITDETSPGSAIAIAASSAYLDAPGSITAGPMDTEKGGITVRRDDSRPAGNISIGSEIAPTSVRLGYFSSRQAADGVNANKGGNISVRTLGRLDLFAAFDTRTGGAAVKTIPDGTSPDEIKFFASVASQANGDGGNITINADGGIKTIGSITSASSPIDPDIDIAIGQGGDIELQTTNGPIEVEGFIRSFGETAGGDICARAGILGGSCSSSEGSPTGGTESFLAPGESSITVVGDIESSAQTSNTIGGSGNVLLEARDKITTANVKTTSIGGPSFDTSGDIDIVSRRGDIDTTGGELNASTQTGDAGDIRLRAFGKVETGDIFSGSKANSGNRGTSDEIQIRSESLVALNGVEYVTSTLGTGASLGDITIESPEIQIINSTFRTDTFNSAVSGTESGADAGDIRIGTNTTNNPVYANNTVLISKSELSTATHGNHEGKFSVPGDSGQITIGGTTSSEVTIGDNSTITSETHANLIPSRNVDVALTEYTQYSQDISYDAGNGGSIEVQGQRVALEGSSKLISSTYGSGTGGDILVDAENIEIAEGSSILSETSGAQEGANAGNVFVGSVDPSGSLTTDFSNSSINVVGSNISSATGVTQTPPPDAVTDGDPIRLGNALDPEFGVANAGNVSIGNAATTEQVQISGGPVEGVATRSDISASSSANDLGTAPGEFAGDSGSVEIRANNTTGRITVTDSTIRNSTVDGTGDNTLLEGGTVEIIDSDIDTSTNGEGNSGSISIISTQQDADRNTQELLIQRSTLTASNTGNATGNVGEILLQSEDQLRVTDQSEISNIVLRGNGRNIILDGGTVAIEEQSDVATDTRSTGGAGNIIITSSQSDSNSDTPEVLISNSNVTAVTSSVGKAGGIDVNSGDGDTQILASSKVSSSTSRSGDGNNIELKGQNLAIRDGSVVQAESQSGTGKPGSVNIDTKEKVEVSGSNPLGQVSEISTFSSRSTLLPEATGGACSVGCIDIKTQDLSLSERGRVSAATNSANDQVIGGGIDIDTQNLTIETGGKIVTSSLSLAETAATAGDINVNASGTITIGGSSPAFTELDEDVIILEGFGSSRFDLSSPNATGESKLTRITISTGAGALPIGLLESELDLTAGSLSEENLQPGTSIEGPKGDSVEGSGFTLSASSNSPAALNFQGKFITREGISPFFFSPFLLPTSVGADNDFSFTVQNPQGEEATLSSANILTSVCTDNTCSNTTPGLTQPSFFSRVREVDLPISQVNISSGNRFSLGVVDVSDTADTSVIQLSNIETNQRVIIADRFTEPNETFQSGIFAEAESGKSGQINIINNPNQSIDLSLDDGARISNSTGSGVATDISLTGIQNLTLNGNAKISTETKSGKAGSITVNLNEPAASSITLNDTSSISVKAENSDDGTVSGTAGQVILNTEQLKLVGTGTLPERRASITATTTSGTIFDNRQDAIILENLETLNITNGDITTSTQTGKAGNVTLNQNSTAAAQNVNLNNGIISVRASANDGEAGDIFIRSQKINGSNDSSIQASNIDDETGLGNITFQEVKGLDVSDTTISASTTNGQAGSITLNQGQAQDAANSVTLSGNSSISVAAANDNADPVDNGDAGVVLLNTNNLTLSGTSETERSTISAKTTGGIGQEINLQNIDNLNVTNGSITGTTDSGTAARILLNEGGDAADTVRLNNGDLSVSSQDGIASDLNINTRELIAENGSTISTSTATNEAGDIVIAPNSGVASKVELSDTTVSARAGSGGNAGGVLIRAQEVSTENSVITASNADSDVANPGNVVLENVQTLSATNTEISASTSSGRAGAVSINSGQSEAESVTLNGGTQVLAKADAGGQAGGVSINTQRLNADSSTIEASNVDSRTTPGNVNLTNIDELSATNAKITASTSSGIAGSVTIDGGQTANGETVAADDVDLKGSEISATANASGGEAGNILVQTRELDASNNSLITASNIDAAEGGSITLNQLRNLSADNSLISTQTESGIAGDITVNASQEVTLSGTSNQTRQDGTDSIALGGISAAASDGGTAGNVNINAGQLTVRDQARIEVSSPRGLAGNLTIEATDSQTDFNILLDNGNLLAETGSLDDSGATINLTAPRFILLRNESLISAEAFDNANGGNINVDALFLLGLLPQGPDGSDIVARANEGNGGVIDLKSSIAFIFKEGKAVPGNQTNDLDVTSREGGSGTVGGDSINEGPQGTEELPEGFTEGDDELVAQCAANGSPSESQGSEFAIAGKGGLPQSPTELLGAETNPSDWVQLSTQPDTLPPIAQATQSNPQNPLPELVAKVTELHSSGQANVKDERISKESDDGEYTEAELQAKCRQVMQLSQASTSSSL